MRLFHRLSNIRQECTVIFSVFIQNIFSNYQMIPFALSNDYCSSISLLIDTKYYSVYVKYHIMVYCIFIEIIVQQCILMCCNNIYLCRFVSPFIYVLLDALNAASEFACSGQALGNKCVEGDASRGVWLVSTTNGIACPQRARHYSPCVLLVFFLLLSSTTNQEDTGFVYTATIRR
jgi:hypothetical protein